MRRFVRFPAALALASLGLSCGGNVQPVDVKLITRACAADPAVDPLTGVSMLRFTVYGDGIEPFKTQSRQALASKSAELPNIPAGKNRNIVVEGVKSGSEETVVSRGETGPLDLSETTDPLSTAVFLRKVDGFTPVATQDAPQTCGTLATTRAAHTATTLHDGRVLVAGGFFLDAAGSAYLKSTEIYDPKTGILSPGPDMTLPRAYHTATHVPGTHLTIIAGGENQPSGSTGGALKVAELFDEDHNTFTIVQMRAQRTRHAAAVPPDGSGVLLVGGFNAAGVPQASTEVFNPQTKAFEDGPALPTARAEVSAVGLTGGRVVVIGGYDGSQVVAKTELYVERPNSATYDRAGADWDVTLKGSSGQLEGRTYPGVAAIDDRYVLVAGGFTQHAALPQQYASATTFIIDTDGKKASLGPALTTKRGHAGVVPLLDGTILVAGGGYADGSTKANETADLFYAASQPAANGPVQPRPTGSMTDARYLGAYTRLADGTVLASGGISYDGSKAVFLKSAEIYQPAYVITPTSPYR